MRNKIKQYIQKWEERGYENGIPNEVPERLFALGLAPSYKAIALAILKNDHSMKSLGFTPKISLYYRELKRIELKNRNNKNYSQNGEGEKK